jgi:signal recognition particle subunit SRP54
MFDQLSDRLTHSLRQLSGRGRLTEKNIRDTLKEVRVALLEADVALPVVKSFIATVRVRALGQEVARSLNPGQTLIKIVQHQLELALGHHTEGLDLATAPPAVIMVAGLQGAGKTTSVVKLARWLKQTRQKKVLVTSTDIYRPAAIDQLRTLAEAAGLDFFPSSPEQNPVTIAQQAIAEAQVQLQDVVIIDTAGRLHIDQEMMAEIKSLHQAVKPVETLFVVDSMTGQDAANTAQAFNQALALTGVILTKVDGDARGGAALSVKTITGKPIKFLGVGEKTDALEVFHPDRIASRILGMGDVLSLIEQAEQKVDKQQAARFAKKIHKGQGFDLADFREQLQQMKKMGGMTGLLDKLPGNLGNMAGAAKSQLNDKNVLRMEAIINSMTPHERHFPDAINGSRKRRIAAGSGVQIQDINRLLKQFKQMQKVSKKLGKKGNMQKMMRSLEGQLPPGAGFS